MTPALRELDLHGLPLEGVQLIEASAGTGKTWALCGLYVRLLLERGLDVEQILVVTFTKAATAELHERIRARVADLLAVVEGRQPADAVFAAPLLARLRARPGHDDTRLRARLFAALTGFEHAAIHTIHAFCQRALGDVPIAAGQPLAMVVTPDDAEQTERAVADFWRREVAHGTLPESLVQHLAALGDTPAGWAVWLRQAQASPLAARLWPEADGADLAAREADFASAWRAAEALWQRDPHAPGTAVRAALGGLKANMVNADGVARAETAWARAFAAADAGAVLDEPKAGLLTAGKLASATRKGAATPDHPFFAAAEAALAAAGASRAALDLARLALLRRMLETVPAQLAGAKRNARTLAYDDLLSRLHEALAGAQGDTLAARLRARYPAALIDEFQDTDPQQYAVFARIWHPQGPLCLIGDPKQAIYAFRNADLRTYLHARAQAAGQWSLPENQRASGSLIDASNTLFSRNRRLFVLDGLDYVQVREGRKPRLPLHDASGVSRPALQLWHLPWCDDPEAPAVLLREDALARAAELCAGEIARLLDAAQAGRLQLGTDPLGPADLAVLVRSHRQGRRMKAALAARGIGAVELGQQSVWHSTEADDLERVLQALHEPGRLPAVLAALATRFHGHDAAALAALVADDTALQAWLSRFAAWRDTWRRRGLPAALRAWQVDVGVATRLLALPAGERRMTNLLHLGELLAALAVRHPTAEALLHAFAAERREATDADAAQLRLESDRHLVHIVTVHKSKGLEYPIVFCPFLWDGHPAPERQAAAVAWHDPARGNLLDYRPGAAQDEAVRARRAEDAAAEAIRLIYVALTRAVHRCYLVAGVYGTATRGKPSLKQALGSALNWVVAQDPPDFATWRADSTRTAATVMADWQALAQAAAPHLALAPLPEALGPQHLSSATPALTLVLPPAPPAVVPAWRSASFSRLMHAADSPGDHDLHAAPMRATAPSETVLAGIAAGDILRFPRGASAGDCIHTAFEAHLALGQPPAEAARTALARHPQPGGPDTLYAGMLAGLLDEVMATDLGEGLVLGALDRRQMRVEAGFHLPLGGLRVEALSGTLAAQGYPLALPAFAPVAGYLSGFIDLLFEHDGRHYLLDWKSNHLGWTPADYAPERLDTAMHDNGYPLQFMLYAVALHRLLARRLPGYDYARHFGGVRYLFVRGVRPGWRTPDGRATGVYAHRPTLAAIEALDRLLEGRARPS